MACAVALEVAPIAVLRVHLQSYDNMVLLLTAKLLYRPQPYGPTDLTPYKPSGLSPISPLARMTYCHQGPIDHQSYGPTDLTPYRPSGLSPISLMARMAYCHQEPIDHQSYGPTDLSPSGA